MLRKFSEILPEFAFLIKKVHEICRFFLLFMTEQLQKRNYSGACGK
jgi:hypothetical protein